MEALFSRYVRLSCVGFVGGSRSESWEATRARGVGERAEGHRRQSRVRYEVTSVVKRNSRVFGRLGRLRGGFEKWKSSLKTC
jgi:hypothetical protein